MTRGPIRARMLSATLLVLVAGGCELPSFGEELPEPPPDPQPDEPGGGRDDPEAVPEPSPPDGFVEMQVRSVRPGVRGHELALEDMRGRTVVPMIIGGSEANAIRMRMQGRKFERPLTHDLLDAIVHELGGEVIQVEVEGVPGGVFVASIVLWNGNRKMEVDSRTSDGVAVALGHDAPIYVSQSVIDRTGVPTGRSGPRR